MNSALTFNTAVTTLCNLLKNPELSAETKEEAQKTLRRVLRAYPQDAEPQDTEPNTPEHPISAWSEQDHCELETPPQTPTPSSPAGFLVRTESGEC